MAVVRGRNRKGSDLHEAGQGAGAELPQHPRHRGVRGREQQDDPRGPERGGEVGRPPGAPADQPAGGHQAVRPAARLPSRPAERHHHWQGHPGAGAGGDGLVRARRGRPERVAAVPSGGGAPVPRHAAPRRQLHARTGGRTGQAELRRPRGRSCAPGPALGRAGERGRRQAQHGAEGDHVGLAAERHRRRRKGRGARRMAEGCGRDRRRGRREGERAPAKAARPGRSLGRSRRGADHPVPAAPALRPLQQLLPRPAAHPSRQARAAHREQRLR